MATNTQNAMIVAAATLTASLNQKDPVSDPDMLKELYAACLAIVADGYHEHVLRYRPRLQD